MFYKKLTSILVALGLLATTTAQVFAQDAGTATDPNANTGTVTNTDPGTPSDDADEKTPEKLVKKQKVDLVCMQTAVEKRDNAVIAALDTYYTNVKTALVARRDALKAAWGMTDRKARQEAIRKAWNDFKGTWKKERKALNTARKAAWKQFDKDKKVCHGQGEGEDQGNDSNL